MIDAAIYARLSADTAVAAIVGTKIYPVQAPKNAVAPWVRWQRISRVQPRDLAAIGGLIKTRIQFDCIAETYSDSRALSEAVRAAVQNWQDVAEGIEDADAENSRDSFEPIADKSYHIASLDFVITHQNAT